MPAYHFPSPQSQRDDDALKLDAQRLLVSKLQLQSNPLLQSVSTQDSHGGSLLWRWDGDRVLRATPVREGCRESIAHAWDLLDACRDIPGIPGKWHPRPAWESNGYFWTLLEWLPGNPWDPWEPAPPNRDRVGDAFDLLRLVHGRSSDVLGTTRGELPCVTRRRDLSASLPGMLRRLLSEKAAPEVVTRLAACLEARAREFERVVDCLPRTGPLMVVHGDSRPLNFILAPFNDLGLTDFNNSRLDHPASDLARLVSGCPGMPTRDSLTADLARTNRWGSMVQWLGRWLDSRAMGRQVENRLNELMRLDLLDQ